MRGAPASRALAGLTFLLALVIGVGHGGAVTPRTTTDPTLRPIAWITRSGATLLQNGRPWRFSGVNMYWLGLDENHADALGPTYPSHGSVSRALGAAASLGATVVRSTTLGVSVGGPRSLEPQLGQFNQDAFDAIDYAVATARADGLHLIIPLTDEWHFYEGGKHTFTAWAGYPDLPGQNLVTSSAQRASEAHFYTDSAVIARVPRLRGAAGRARQPLHRHPPRQRPDDRGVGDGQRALGRTAFLDRADGAVTSRPSRPAR